MFDLIKRGAVCVNHSTVVPGTGKGSRTFGRAFEKGDEASQLHQGTQTRPRLHRHGSTFAAVYPDGDAAHALTGVSIYPISPGQGVVLDAVMQQPGNYPFVDHSMRDMMIGSAGLLNVGPVN